MSSPPQKPRSSLPLHLAGADRVWQGDRAKRFFAASIKWFAAGLLVLLILDLIFHLSPWARLGGLALAGIAVLGVFVAMFWIALLSQSPLERIARLLESRCPKLGSKLINIIQLQEQIDDESLSDATRSLARRAVEDADGTLADFQLKEIAKTPLEKNQILGAVIPIAAVILLGVVFFKITALEALRFVDPFGDHPPFAFTTLKIIAPEEDGHSVVYRQNAIIEAEWSGHDPKDLFLTAWDPAAPEESIRTVPMIRKMEKTFVQQLENVTTDLVAYVHAKDRRARSGQRIIKVLLTPQISESEVEILLPDYTRSKPRQLPYHYKTLQTLRDSQLTFSITSNRPLSAGEIKVTSSGGEVSAIAMQPDPEEPETVRGSMMARDSARLDFSVTDIAGIDSEEELSGGLVVTRDLAPTVRITEPYSDSFIVINHQFDAAFEATDDYGVDRLRLHRALNSIYSPPRTFALEGRPKRKVQVVPFDLPGLGVEPGDVISFYAEAVDNAPEPQMARTETRHLLVISEEDYNDQMRERSDLSMIEEKFNSLEEDFEKLIEEQERIADKLDQLSNEETNSETSEEQQRKETGKLLEEQSQLNEKITGHAKRMEDFSREKPLYDMERSLQRKLDERSEELRESARENEEVTQNSCETCRGGSPGDGGGNSGSETSPQQSENGSNQSAQAGGETAQEGSSAQQGSNGGPSMAGGSGGSPGSQSGSSQQGEGGSQQGASGSGGGGQSPSQNDLASALDQSREAARRQLETMRGSQEQQQDSVSEPLEDLADMHELMKDFSHFQELYEHQEQIAEQSSAYESGRDLDNTDRMALQNLAAQEESIRRQLEDLSEKLKQDAAAAQENFPKAAQSGQDLADQIDAARLPQLAESSAASMLNGKGPQSAERAERLRREMENLLNNCQACQNGGSSLASELDQYLTLQQMAPGNTFEQMMQSRLFGQGQGQNGSPGMGGMSGMGMGSAGTGGRFGSTFSPNMGMLGGDSELGDMSGGKGNSRRHGPGTPGETASTEDNAKADSLPEIKPATRQTKAVAPEILAEKYRGIVEEYFRALTRPQSAPIPKPPVEQ